MDNARLVRRFCHMNPRVKPETLEELLRYQPRFFRWAGCDLFHCATWSGARHMVVVETNSCPSGQKSMPLVNEGEEMGGYKKLIQTTFSELLKRDLPVAGGLAVVYDKNLMEASGYAAALADLTGERVLLVEYYLGDELASVRWEDGVMHVRTEDGAWQPIRAAFRYVTQSPWTRFPLSSKTLVLNPILPCLAGGRNKLVASKAYDLFNAELAASETGLKIRVPETKHDIAKTEVPLWVHSFGGHAVVKVPYGNAGQGVYTITTDAELEEFMAEDHKYDKFIVQSLVGNSQWSSTTAAGQLFHVGTIPNRKGEIYVSDLRMMVSATDRGFQPVAVYARRAHEPLADRLEVGGPSSWNMLGTNLSIKTGHMSWDTETNRLLLMDRKDFNKLGIGIDELIDGYVQTVLATIAIDKMCCRLVRDDGSFNMDLFTSLNNDEVLLREITP